LTARAAPPSARVGQDTVEITDGRVFGPSGEALARRFARRVLQFNEVRSLALNPARATATVNYQLAHGDPGSFLTRLADAVAAPAAGVNETALPRWTEGEQVILYRHSTIVSLFAELNITHGQLTARHPAMERNQAIACRVERALRSIAGVTEATATGDLRVRFEPHVVAARQLIRIAEAEIVGLSSGVAALVSQPVDFTLANVSLGTAAVSDLVLPAVAPVTAGLLVLSNLVTFGAAADQLCRGKIGLPLLYASMVGVTLASGQFLSSALMLWFFRYWQQRYRRDLEVESRALLDDSVALPQEVRLLTADGLERLVLRREITAGDRVRTLPGESVPADAIVHAGAALVDETALAGASMLRRKIAGDKVFAGSRCAPAPSISSCWTRATRRGRRGSRGR
jgi:cation transport ATPase